MLIPFELSTFLPCEYLIFWIYFQNLMIAISLDYKKLLVEQKSKLKFGIVRFHWKYEMKI